MQDRRVSDLLSILATTPDRQWTSSSLATSVGLSASHLRRKFVAQTGQPPMQYLRQLRLNLAMDLLLSKTYWTVKEIGVAVGFCDMSHFVRAFRRRSGQSPTQYRRAHGVRPTNGTLTRSASVCGRVRTFGNSLCRSVSVARVWLGFCRASRAIGVGVPRRTVMILRAMRYRLGRALFVLSCAIVLGGSAIESVHAGEANCTQGGSCDCCRNYWCTGRHSLVCPSGHHDCGHHIGTDCN